MKVLLQTDNFVVEKLELTDFVYNIIVHNVLSSKTKDIVSFYKPFYELEKSKECKLLILICDDKQVFKFPVIGKDRSKAVFELFNVLNNKEPTNMVIRFPQDNSSFGLFRHYSKIITIGVE
jgi:hypothetical protein